MFYERRNFELKSIFYTYTYTYTSYTLSRVKYYCLMYDCVVLTLEPLINYF